MEKRVYALPSLALLDDRKPCRQLAAKPECLFICRTTMVRDQAFLIRCERCVERCIYRFEDVANTNASIALHVDVPLEWTSLEVDGHLDQLLICGRLIKVGIRQACPLDTVRRVLPELDVVSWKSNIEVKKSL